jgi:site-specific DNA recombinase
MAQRLGINRDILSAQMRLTYLAPDIVRALVLVWHAEGLTPAGLLSLCKDLPHDRLLQRTVLGVETP